MIKNVITLLSSVTHVSVGLVLLFLTSCATLHQNYNTTDLLVYRADHDDTVMERYLPGFLIENPGEKHNLIGTPTVGDDGGSVGKLYVSDEISTVYTERRSFDTAKDSYSNLIYRIHFKEIPFSIFPFYLGVGKNVGLIVVVTLNSDGLPVLYTTVHTCGCYLAFIPTSYMDQDAFPDDWDRADQSVYGEVLPGILDFKEVSLSKSITTVLIRNNTHRVKDVFISDRENLMDHKTSKARLQPLDLLHHLPQKKGGSASFYQESGEGKGYVRGSSKPWEWLLMSWWVFDGRVGQDKYFGRDRGDGPVFYTSLKPWARNESDMRDFPTFLNYWGWKL